MRGWPHRRMRWAILATCGALLIAGGLAYRHYWLSRPMGEGPAGPSVPREAFHRPWTSRPVLLLGVGDSITAGLGASRRDLSYFQRLVLNPPDEFPDMRGLCLSTVIPNLEAHNKALSGTNSLQHEQMLEQLEIQDPDVLGLVVMTTGGNDLIHWYGRSTPREGAMYGATYAQAKPWIRNFERRLDRMVDMLETRFPGGCMIFLGDIYDPSDGVGDAPSAFLPAWPDALRIHGAYNDVLHRCAASRPSVHIVPIHRAFLGHGIHCSQFWREHHRPEDPHYWYWYNLEDPNDRGYDAIRRLYLIEMAKALADEPLVSPESASKPQGMPLPIVATRFMSAWGFVGDGWLGQQRAIDVLLKETSPRHAPAERRENAKDANHARGASEIQL